MGSPVRLPSLLRSLMGLLAIDGVVRLHICQHGKCAWRLWCRHYETYIMSRLSLLL